MQYLRAWRSRQRVLATHATKSREGTNDMIHAERGRQAFACLLAFATLLLAASFAGDATAATPPLAQFNRETYAYSTTLSTSQEANRYQVMVLQASNHAEVPLLKAANPNLKILMYSNLLALEPERRAGVGGVHAILDRQQRAPDLVPHRPEREADPIVGLLRELRDGRGKHRPISRPALRMRWRSPTSTSSMASTSTAPRQTSPGPWDDHHGPQVHDAARLAGRRLLDAHLPRGAGPRAASPDRGEHRRRRDPARSLAEVDDSAWTAPWRRAGWTPA